MRVHLPLMFMFLLAAGGCAVEPVTREPSAAAIEQANAFFEQAFDERLKLSPLQQTALGIKTDYDKWDDVSEEGRRRVHELVREQLRRLESTIDYAALDDQTRVSYDLFKYDAERRIEQYAWRYHGYPVNQMSGVQSGTPAFLINMHRVDTREDAESYIARLEGIRPMFDDVIGDLRVRRDRGIVPPRFVFPYVLDDARNVISGRPFDGSDKDSVLLEDFRGKLARLKLAAAEEGALIARAESALRTSVKPAYDALIAAVTDLQRQATAEDGAWKLPQGGEFYRFALRQMTTTDLAPDEIHAIGLAAVERIHAAMRGVMRDVKFTGSLQDFFEYMRTDERFYYPDTAAGRAAYLRDVNAVIDALRPRLGELFQTFPKAELVVKAVEPFRERSAGKAFYQRPTPDGARPGTYYANLYDMRDMPNYELEALAYHEAIPGHHMQLAIAIELEDVPRFRRQFPATAYTEGWGLYAERLGKEMGFYQDPYSEYGRLTLELIRAVRLVVDTGIHAKRWTREQAIQYHLDNTPLTEGAAVKAVERYIVMPGQATAYMIGQQKILELRERAETQLGTRFDIREFHDVVLRSGPVTLGVLEQQVQEYIQRGT